MHTPTLVAEQLRKIPEPPKLDVNIIKFPKLYYLFILKTFLFYETNNNLISHILLFLFQTHIIKPVPITHIIEKLVVIPTPPKLEVITYHLNKTII